MTDSVETTVGHGFRWRTALRFSRYLLLHKPLLGVSLLFMLLATAATVAAPRVLGLLVDQALLPKDAVRLQTLALLFLAAEFVRVTATGAYGFVFTVLGQRVMQRLREDVFMHLMSLSMLRAGEAQSGQVVMRTTNDIAALSNMFSGGFIDALGKLVTVVVVAASLLFLDLRLASIVLTLFVCLFTVTILLTAQLHGRYVALRSALARYGGLLSESLSGIKVLHAFNRERQYQTRLSRANEEFARAQFAPTQLMAFIHPAVAFTNAIAMMLVIWYGGSLVYGGQLQLGLLVTFFTYVLWLFWPVLHVVFRWDIFLSAMAAADRTFELLDWPPEPALSTVTSPPAALPQLQGEIVFDHVWFAYTGEEWVLRDVNFEIRARSARLSYSRISRPSIRIRPRWGS